MSTKDDAAGAGFFIFAILATITIAVLVLLTGCASQSFPIGGGYEVERIRIEPQPTVWA